MKLTKRTAVILFTAIPVTTLLLAALVVIVATGLPFRSPHTGYTVIANPATAQQVSDKLGATNFRDCGPGPLGGVQDSGTAKYHGTVVGVNTFATDDIRNNWLTTATALGVTPLVKGTSWIVYKALGNGECT